MKLRVKSYDKLFYSPFALFCVLFFALNATAQTQTQSEVHLPSGEIPDIGGYYLSYPVGYDPNGTTNYPLLLFFHGVDAMGDGSASSSTGLPKLLTEGTDPPYLLSQGQFPSSFTVNGQNFSFIVVSPQVAVRDTAVQINQFLDSLVSWYHVDTTRIYLTGLSMGGGESWNYLSDNDYYCNRIAAAAIMAGQADTTNPRVDILARNNLPVWAFHDNQDPIVPYAYSQHWINGMNAYNPAPKPAAQLTTYINKTHPNAWETTYNPSYDVTGSLNVYEWLLQYTQRSESVLPIQLIDFSASRQGDNINLTWNTASEINADHFTIARSIDGKTFIPLVTIKALGSSTNGQHYEFTDDNIMKLPASVIYYQLRETDKNGKTIILKTISISIDNDINIISINPNPFSDNLTIQANFKHSGTTTISLISILGKRIFFTTKNVENNYNNISLNELSFMIPGIYFIEINQNGKAVREELIKK